MKIGALYIVHYGMQYLKWSIRSVQDQVDGVFVFYTNTPSHGHQTNVQCPETRQMIIDSIQGMNVNWHDCGPFSHEGAHRDFAEKAMADMGYDHLLIVDADEIWDPFLLEKFIAFGVKSPARHVCVGMRHFWRSLKWVCDDDCEPNRMVNVKHTNGDSYYPLDGGKVFHMGYAQSVKLTAYKISIHGHLGEWRNDWWQEKFLRWRSGSDITDVHPTNLNFWTPAPYVDNNNKLMKLVYDHPYWHKELIE